MITYTIIDQAAPSRENPSPLDEQSMCVKSFGNCSMSFQAQIFKRDDVNNLMDILGSSAMHIPEDMKPSTPLLLGNLLSSISQANI